MAPADTSLTLGTDVPAVPAPADREWLLDTLGRLVAAGGAAALLAPPVVPGDAAFPDPWRPTLVGLRRVVRRLTWHAGLADRKVELTDARDEAVATGKLVATEAEVESVTAATVRLAVYSIGSDDVAGTLAHEVGVAIAVALGVIGGDPYRAVDPSQPAVERPEEDLRIGSVAAVWAGLGVLAANASYQQYSSGQYKAHLGFAPLEYEVIRAGHLPLGALAFLLAVQAEIRGEGPDSLGGPQRDEVAAWRRALAGRGAALRARLAIAPDLAGAPRPEPVAWPDEPDPEHDVARTKKKAARVYRVTYNRGGPGAMVGVVVGALGGGAAGSAAGLGVCLALGIGLGYLVGRGSHRDRCSDCITPLPATATTCPKCGGAIAGTIGHRNQRLDHDDEDEAEVEADDEAEAGGELPADQAQR